MPQDEPDGFPRTPRADLESFQKGPASPEALVSWRSISDVYWQPIVAYAMRKQCPFPEANDVAAATMIQLMRIEADPAKRLVFSDGAPDRGQARRFRHRVWSVARRKVFEVMRKAGKWSRDGQGVEIPYPPARDGEQGVAGLEELISACEREDVRGAVYDSTDLHEILEWCRATVFSAYDEVRKSGKFGAVAMEIFDDAAVKGKSAVEVARKHGKEPGAIDIQVKRVRDSIAERVSLRTGLCGEALNQIIQLVAPKKKQARVSSERVIIPETLRVQDMRPSEVENRLDVAQECLRCLTALATCPQASLALRSKDRFISALIHDTLTVGRDPENHFRVADDPYLGRHHFRIFREGDDFAVEDVGSRNGIRINQRPKLVGDWILSDGDMIAAGDSEFVFFTPHSNEAG